ncbi:MAG: hypothetical protein HC903_30000 [Methylacidiphilales bacterium]|nr:hypothetical protein [Candidatus Methylacidiphilales bacterium]NJR19541.1 hypothetical protein [Calothrix sp. CSU_2_0]
MAWRYDSIYAIKNAIALPVNTPNAIAFAETSPNRDRLAQFHHARND